ncbi:MAG TPA: alpha hydrolase [Methanocorpusculum sp.]|nr:alpha hydrolase [Methanocorpusculum sp.]
MKAAVLYSGGKDSSLAAIILSKYYDVELVTFVFNPDNPVESIENAAKLMGLPWKKQKFDPMLIDTVIEMILKDKHPANAINEIHKHALNILAQEYEIIADGTRRDDRVPMRTIAEIQSLEMKFGVSYIRPLLGMGRKEIIRICERYFEIVYGESGSIPNGDFETEIRAEMKKRGIDYSKFFPKDHEQSLIIRKKCDIS